MLVVKRLTQDPANFTNSEVAETLTTHYNIVEKRVEAFAQGNLPKRGLIVNGPAGGGKTETVVRVLTAAGVDAICISGTITAPELFIRLYRTRKPNQILVIDDTDAVLEDTEMCDILKGAIDTGKPKQISYCKRSQNLRVADVPQEFVFAGKIILITNKHINTNNFSAKECQRLRPVYERCNYVYAGLSKAWTVAAIQQHYAQGNIRCLNESGLPNSAKQDIIDFIVDNVDDLPMVSFRTVIACISNYMIDADNWQTYAWQELTGGY